MYCIIMIFEVAIVPPAECTFTKLLFQLANIFTFFIIMNSRLHWG